MTLTNKSPEVSIVIPAYNEIARIGRTIQALIAFFDKENVSYDLIVVMDGCTDGTTEFVLNMAKQYKQLVPLVYPNRLGKGGALIRGSEYARGSYLLFLDADCPTPPEDLYRLIKKAKMYDVVIGSRYLKNSKVIVKEPPLRILLSRAFNLLVRLMFRELRGIRDTQCGVKVLRRKVMQQLESIRRLVNTIRCSLS
mgnify:CR=1 FL=1